MATAPRDPPARGGKPSITYRYAGDRAVLVEYGEMEFDLTLNFLVLAIDAALRGRSRSRADRDRARLPVDPASCTTRGAPASRARRSPPTVSTTRCRPSTGMTIPSRLIHLPLAFDDSSSRDAVAALRRTIRKDAPNAEGGDEHRLHRPLQRLRRSRGALRGGARRREQWSAFIGFFPGLPFMFPLDPREPCSCPKYNPTRTWTAEGAVGSAGRAVAIYPVESAGGYQLFGRTLPIYDLAAAQRGLPRQPAAHPPRRPRVVPPGRGGRAARRRSRTCAPTATATGSRTARSTWRSSSALAADDRGRGRRSAARGARRRPPRRPCHERRSQSRSKAASRRRSRTIPGRRGMLAQGFFPAGPMDHFALRAANLLVGNPSSAAALEVTLGNLTHAVRRAARPWPSAARRRELTLGRRARSRSGRAIACRRAPRYGSASRQGPGFRMLRRDRGRRFDVPPRSRLARHLHDGRARRFRGPGAAHRRPASARRRARQRRSAPRGRRFKASERPEYAREWEIGRCAARMPTPTS